jgi:hypothetical protein
VNFVIATPNSRVAIRAGQTIPLEIVNDHLVADWPGIGRVVVDTGSPVTVPGAGDLVPGGLNIARLGSLIGTRLDGLVGMDTLGAQPFVVDWAASRLVLGAVDGVAGGRAVALELRQGLPVVPMTIGGAERPVILDTGATVSYFVQGLVDMANPTGVFRDFVREADFVEFDTPLATVDVTLGGVPFRLTAGVPPRHLDMWLRAFGVAGVVGRDVWRNARVAIDVPGARAVIDSPAGLTGAGPFVR